MTKFGTSQPVRRVEDPRLLTGAGGYIDDIAPAEALHAAFLRAPVAHAKITALDVSAARGAPGVAAVITGADLDAAVENGVDGATVTNRDGAPGAAPRRPAIATDTVRYAGEAVAMVLADTLAQARDAAELIAFEWEELPANADPTAAANAAQIHPEAPGNQAYDWAFGDAVAVMQAFDAADDVVTLPLVNNRVIAASMEPRGAFAEWDAAAGKLHLAFNGQGVWGLKDQLARRMALAPEKVRITNPADIGGGFGMKGFAYPEYLALAHAARSLDRPVRWMSDRSEAMVTDVSGRDNVTTIRGAFDKDRRLTALHVSITSNLGAYNSGYGQFIQSELAKFVAPGVYAVPLILMETKGVYTNTTPVDAYRGAGRPEAIYALERLMDAAARQFDMGQEEIRRINFIPPEAFPYTTAVEETYDVGQFDKVLTRALRESDWEGFEARRSEAAGRGRLLGRGLCCYIESILGAQNETTRIEFAEDGGLDLYVGTQSNGQGHETVYSQILHQRTGLPFDRIRVRMGDSDLIATGGGTGGSRSVTMQGNSINAASDEMIEKFRALAEEELEAPAADLEFSDGAWRVAGTDKAITLMELSVAARKAGKTELLTTERENTVPGRSYPNGAHIAEVEADPETGHMQVVRYTVVDDLGVLMNPMLAEGQVHGGVIQGIGQALTERVAHDEGAQLLSASFMDYAIPRAKDVPNVPFHSEPTPSTANPIGMKGCGEAGTVGALAAVTNAGLDALWPAGVRHVDMPMTPQRVWGWIRDADAA
ncbi:xanthine dehydrogenase family protein molybdopterin-binding subunit [Rhodovulum sp. DZ06]|uniref:xanthine dehydrogenase family protein molybdopterin-binding subunit n=1 Tax=Rhodovulum sp. DZ06 TaxID=3425126 RepID=UPI003D34FBA8